MTDAEPGFDPLDLTAHEIQYLFTLEDSSIATRNRELLSLPAMEVASDLGVAGASTLVVRGLATIVDDKVLLADEAAVVGYVLTHAEAWTEIGFLVGDTADAALLFNSGEFSIILTPGVLGMYSVSALQPPATLRTVTSGLVTAFIDEGPDRIATVRSGAGEVEDSVAIVRHGDDRWRLASPVARPTDDAEWDESSFRDVHRDEALTALDALPW